MMLFKCMYAWPLSGLVALLLLLRITEQTETVSYAVYFAEYSNTMIPSANHTLRPPARISMEECARQCFMASYRASNMDRNATMPQRPPCMSFEYVTSMGICIQFKVSSTTGLQNGYRDMKPAAGTSYFELSKAPTALFSRWKHCAFSGEHEYYKVLYNSTLQSCAHACISAPSLGCSSFAYNVDRSICATSEFVASSDHKLEQTEAYDYYHYNGNWPCNASLPWKYTPRVIASQGYPYVNNNMGTCHFRLVAAPNHYISVQVKAFVSNLTSCNGNDDGVYIYGYNTTTSTSQLLTRLCNTTHSSTPPTFTSSSRFVFIRIVQQTGVLVTRIVYDFVDASSCLEHRCLNGGTCSSAVNGHKCTCPVGFSGEFCETNVDDCAGIPCMFNGRCLDGINSYTCECLPGTSGDHCQNYIGDCHSNPCVNGTCSPSSSGYQCACATGFTGRNCEYDIDECYSSPCLYGECVDLIDGYKCQCSANYTGNLCEVNEIQSVCNGNTCSFGTCAVNTSGSYCQCFPGFVGATCAENFDDCQSSPCVHGSCIDHVNAYHCNCSSGYVGKHCDLYAEDPCQQNVCIHGYCSVSNEGFTCVCSDGYYGKFCDVVGKPCDSNPCMNGECVNAESGFKCVCSAGFTGENCTHYIKTDICGQTPCFHGHCVATAQPGRNHMAAGNFNTNTFLCVCDAGFTGKLCDAEVNHCLTVDCNYGKCLNSAIGYTCMCDNNYTGSHCSTSVKTCRSQPCMHGVCQEHNTAFRCLCKTGYTGAFCDHQIHTCMPNYCSNGGSCIIVNNTQSCMCTDFYSGLRCETLLPNGHSTTLNQNHFNTLSASSKVTPAINTTPTPLTLFSVKTNIHPTDASILASTEAEHSEAVEYNRSTTVGAPIAQTRGLSTVKRTHPTTKGTSAQLIPSSFTSDIRQLSTTASPTSSRAAVPAVNRVPSQTTSIGTSTISSLHLMSIPVPSSTISTLFTKPYATSKKITSTTKRPIDKTSIPLPEVHHTDSPPLNSTGIGCVTAKSCVSTLISNNVESLPTHTSPVATEQVKSVLYPNVKQVPLKTTHRKQPTTDMIYIKQSTTERDKMVTPTVTDTGISLENSSISTNHVKETTKEMLITTRKYASKNTTRKSTTKWITRLGIPSLHSTTELPSEVTNASSAVKISTVTPIGTVVPTKQRTGMDNSQEPPSHHLHTLEPVLHNEHRDCNTTTCRMKNGNDRQNNGSDAPDNGNSGSDNGGGGPNIGSGACDASFCIFGKCVYNKNRYVCQCEVQYSGSDCSVKIETHDMDDVVTIQSILIGALIVILLVVMGVAGICYYRRMRRGSVYISSPWKPRRNEETSARKCFSARDVHSELTSGRLLSPRAVSSQLYQRRDHINLPSSFPPSPLSSSSSTSRVSSSSNSRGNRYDDVEFAEDLTPPRASGADDRNMSRDLKYHQSGSCTFETFGHHQGLGEYSVPKRQATASDISMTGIDCATGSDRKQGAASGQRQAAVPDRKQMAEPGGRQTTGRDRQQATGRDRMQLARPNGTQAPTPPGRQAVGSARKQVAAACGRQATGPDGKQVTGSGGRQATGADGRQVTRSNGRQATGADGTQLPTPKGKQTAGPDGTMSGVDDTTIHSCVNPFFKHPDGTIGMRLTNNTNRSPDEFRSLLDDILEQGDTIPYPHPGFRRSVHYISGTENGKSDA